MASYLDEAETTLAHIVESTKLLMDHKDPRRHVSTYGERSALRILNRFGSVFIKGISGSGKTDLGLRLLASVSSETGRIPVVLTSPRQWNLIPRSDQKKYIVLVDDIFGSSTMVEVLVDKWCRLFNIMWPQVECGNLFLVMTSRLEICIQSERFVSKYPLIQCVKCVTLDRGEFKLHKNEKKRLFKIYCAKFISLNKEEMEKVVETETSLGFPQCCQFFASSKQAQACGASFFSKPYDFVAREINVLEECDKFGYFVLLLVQMNNGRLDNNFIISMKSSAVFADLVQMLRNACGIEHEISSNNVRRKADSFLGLYLDKAGGCYIFEHQSIFDAVFMKVAQTYPDLAIAVCPGKLLVEMVRTNNQGVTIDETILTVPVTDYDVLADRIADLIQSEDCLDILDHPCLSEPNFVTHMFERWQATGVIPFLNNRLPKGSFTVEVPNHFCYGANISVFHCDCILSCMIVKGHSHLVSLTISQLQKNLPMPKLSMLLACAIFMQNISLAWTLFSFGASPDENSFRALCATSCVYGDVKIIANALLSSDVKWLKLEDFNSMFLLAALNGNNALVRSILGHIQECEKMKITKCIICLLESFGKGGNEVNKAYKTGKKYTEILELLLNSNYKLESEDMLYYAASHSNPSALKSVMNNCPEVNINKMKESVASTPLREAIEYGGLDNVKFLLEHGAVISTTEAIPSKATVIHMAAKSALDGEEKLKLLYSVATSLHASKLDPRPRRKNSTHVSVKDNISQIMKNYINSKDFLERAPLHVAAQNGNIQSLNFLLSIGANINAQDDEDQTPLHFAAQNNHLVCVLALIEAGAGVDIKDSFGFTPLTTPFHSNRAMAQLLLDSGSDPNTKGARNETCLLTAVKYNDTDVVKMLCNKGADINAVMTSLGTTVLFEAVARGDVDMVKILCENGARVDMIGEDSRSLIHEAVESKIDPVEKLTYLLDEHQAPIDEPDSFGSTPLFAAVLLDNPELSEVLMERHADPMRTDKSGQCPIHMICAHSKDNQYSYFVLEIVIRFDKNRRNLVNDTGETIIQVPSYAVQNNHGMTPLHIAVWTGTLECVELLLTCGADTKVKDFYGRTVLHLAANREPCQILELILGTNPDVNSSNEEGATALHIASEYGIKDNVIILLRRGADAFKQNNNGKTALHVAAEEGQKGCVKLFLQQRFDLFILDQMGRSPLHLASKRGATDVVRMLFQQGADINAVDVKGRSPLHLSAKSIDDDCVWFLLSCGVDACLADKNGDTPLHLVTSSGNEVSMQHLITNGVCLNPQNKQGNTPLHLAAMKNFEGGVKILLENDSNPHFQNEKGITSLHIAANNGNYIIVQELLNHRGDVSVEDSLGRTALHCALSSIKKWDMHFHRRADDYLCVVKSLAKASPDLLYSRTGQTPLEMFLSQQHQAGSDEDEEEYNEEYNDYDIDIDQYRQHIIHILKDN